MRTPSVLTTLVCCVLIGCSDSTASPMNPTSIAGQAGALPIAGTSAGVGGSVMMPAGMTAGGAGGMVSSQAGGMANAAGTSSMAGMTAPNPMPDAGAMPDAGPGEMMKPDVPEETCVENMMPNPMAADPCMAPLRPGEDRLCQFSFGGQMRKFYIYTPKSYNACKPASLILDCHGASESAEVHIGVDRFSADAPLGYGSSWRLAVQGDNAIVVTPEGVGLRWARGSDPEFLNTVADMVEKAGKVDPEKRYITGISMGGMITVETGCQDTNRWRGMVPVAMLSNPCASIDRPIPHMAFHATGDALTSYADDKELAEHMAELNGCTTTPETVYYGGPMTSTTDQVACFKEPYGLGSPDAMDPENIPLSACPADRPETSCQVWTGCDEGVEVRFCTVAADDQQLGGHLLYRNDTSLALGPLSWSFLKKFWK